MCQGLYKKTNKQTKKKSNEHTLKHTDKINR